jgi:hypothetical protein
MMFIHAMFSTGHGDVCVCICTAAHAHVGMCVCMHLVCTHAYTHLVCTQDAIFLRLPTYAFVKLT